MYGSADNASDDASHFYFLLPSSKVGCHPALLWLGAAAMTLIFFFLGFLASRLLLCCPFAMSISLGLRTTQIETQNRSIRNQKVSSKIPSPHGAKATTPQISGTLHLGNLAADVSDGSSTALTSPKSNFRSTPRKRTQLGHCRWS